MFVTEYECLYPGDVSELREEAITSDPPNSHVEVIVSSSDEDEVEGM